MRIGKVIIDTDNMSAEELTIIIDAMRKIRARKIKEESLVKRMNDLLNEAQEEGFRFIDKDYGFIRETNDFMVIDERA